MECCQYRVDPLLLLGLIAAIGGLTFFLQQQGRNYFCFSYLYLQFPRRVQRVCVGLEGKDILIKTKNSFSHSCGQYQREEKLQRIWELNEDSKHN